MPIYEYQCTACHHHFDEMQKMTDPAISICPKCQQETVVKLVSAAGFQLKGTGWYATDFKDKGKPKPATETATADSTPKTTESKGDNK